MCGTSMKITGELYPCNNMNKYALLRNFEQILNKCLRLRFDVNAWSKCAYKFQTTTLNSILLHQLQ